MKVKDWKLWALDPDSPDQKFEVVDELPGFSNHPSPMYADLLRLHRHVLANPDFVFRGIRSLDGADPADLIRGLCYVKQVPYRHIEDGQGNLIRSSETASGEVFAVFLDDEKNIIDGGFFLCDQNGLPNRWNERFAAAVYARKGLEHLITPSRKRS
jgi:hypothetical protein